MPEKSTPSQRMRDFLRAKEAKKKLEEAIKHLQDSHQIVPQSKGDLVSLG